jgi:hypothetical protein
MKIIFVTLFLWCSACAAFANEDVQLALPDEVGFQDSIPEKAGERIVIAVPKLQAIWVVALVNSPYEPTRRQLHDVIQNAFGIDSEREIMPTVNAEKPVNPHMPKEPLFGDGLSDFRLIGIRDASAPEYRIDTKPYNTRVRWWKSSSQSRWRLVDGMPLFGKPVSILVVSRTDHSREWARDHTGIPWPFTLMQETKLMTDTEVSLIGSISSHFGDAEVRYFVPYSGYKTNNVLNVMIAIRDAAQQIPE